MGSDFAMYTGSAAALPPGEPTRPRPKTAPLAYRPVAPPAYSTTQGRASN